MTTDRRAVLGLAARAARAFDALPVADDVRAAIMRDNGLRLGNRFGGKA